MADDVNEPPETRPSPTTSWWPIVGWIIIGIMGVLIVFNLLGWVPPDVNRYSLPGLVVAYLIYVVFRRRKT